MMVCSSPSSYLTAVVFGAVAITVFACVGYCYLRKRYGGSSKRG